MPRPCKLKVVSESRVTWATSVSILVFLRLSVLDLGPMYATDRHTDVRHASSLNASAFGPYGAYTQWLLLQICLTYFDDNYFFLSHISYTV